MKKIFFSGLVGLSLFASCGSDATEAKEEKKEFCIYSYNNNSSEFEWEAYKTGGKIPVKGGFNLISVYSEASENAFEMLESITFEMETASVESNDETRNVNIAKYFFETINTEKIEGHFVSVREDGKATIAVAMNGIEFEFDGDYQYNDDLFTFNAIVDVSSWNALPGIEALNEQCHELHMGEDGDSKLWSEVALRFSTRISKECK